MTNLRKSIIAVLVVVIAMVAWIAIGLARTAYTLSHMKEAYAAWDTGTLLVEYMKVHDNKWPSSWDDLLAVLEAQGKNRIPLRGRGGEDLEYARSLRTMVKIDWNFDPAHPSTDSPVARPNGKPLVAFWEDPNQMIRDQMHDKSKQ